MALAESGTATLGPLAGGGGLDASSATGGLASVPTPTLVQQYAEMSKQLAVQMDYNNELLAQLQRLEEQHLVYQKGAQEKQAALRQALAVADAARTEVTETKRKLAISQEVSAKLSDELKEARVDNGILKRQLEALEKLAMEAKNDLATLRAERADLMGRADALAKDVTHWKGAARDAETAAEQDRNDLNGKVAALTTALSEARSKVGPLSADAEALRSALHKAREEVEEAKRSRADALARLDRAGAAIGTLESAVRELRGNEGRLVRALEEESTKVAALQAAAAKDAHVLALKDAEVVAAAHKVADATAEAKAAVEERLALRRELDAVSAELSAALRARAADQEHATARLNEVLADMRRVAEEARLREAAYSQDATRRAEELMAARRAAEEALNAAQADMLKLHDMVTGLREEKASQARTFEDERNSYEQRVRELEHRGAVGAESAGRVENELRATNMALTAELHAAKEDAAAAAQRHLGLLTAMQGALQQLRAEAESNQADFVRLLASAKALHGHVGDAATAAQTPIVAWYEEVQRAFLYLMDLADTARAERTDTADKLRACEVSLEEARSHGLMLEEGLSRLEHDVTEKATRVAELQGLLTARDEAAREAARAASAVNDDLTAEVARLRSTLERANRTHVMLQSDVARAQTELEEANAKHHARVAGLEQQVAALQAEVRGAASQAFAVGDEKTKLADVVAQQVAQIDALRKQVTAVQAAADQAAEASKASLAAYASQVTSLSEQVRRMDGQLKQTQSLLAVVQEQRRTLQENNIALRAELDERYKASLMAAAGVAMNAPPPATAASHVLSASASPLGLPAATAPATADPLAEVNATLQRVRSRSMQLGTTGGAGGEAPAPSPAPAVPQATTPAPAAGAAEEAATPVPALEA